MRIRIIFAIFACKLIHFALRVLRRGGTALPGKVAVKIYPEILKHLAKDIECIVITGTNGKTTSARMLEQFFIDSGADYFSNKSGSNLMQGITGEFAYNATATGKPKRRHAIIECDEGASKKVFEYMNPKLVLVTNVFSDQLDRFGDVGVVLESIRTGVRNSPNAVLCLNADDPLTSTLANGVQNKVVYFGIETALYENNTDESSETTNCISCNTEYEYDYRTYGHLGGFRCPSCGYARKRPDVAVTGLIGHDADRQTIKLRIYDETVDITINLPGAYNIYNATGAIAAATEIGFSVQNAKDAMLSFECGFGRMEKLDLGGLPARMILIKNQIGCDQAINYILSIPEHVLLSICLNDRIADGTDISWIEDARFEKLLGMGEKLRGIYVSGTRADDMARRLERIGLPGGMVQVFSEMDKLLEAMLQQETPVYILPTYTAMLELRGIISRRFDIKKYWE